MKGWSYWLGDYEYLPHTRTIVREGYCDISMEEWYDFCGWYNTPIIPSKYRVSTDIDKRTKIVKQYIKKFFTPLEAKQLDGGK